MKEVFDEIKNHQQPGIAIDISVDFLREIEPSEREGVIRKMLEESHPSDLSTEQLEYIVQQYLSFVDSENFEETLQKRLSDKQD
jgi:hypothetical protein